MERALSINVVEDMVHYVYRRQNTAQTKCDIFNVPAWVRRGPTENLRHWTWQPLVPTNVKQPVC